MNILTFFEQDNPNEEDAVVVEKILGMRIRRRDKDVSLTLSGADSTQPFLTYVEKKCYIMLKFSY